MKATTLRIIAGLLAAWPGVAAAQCVPVPVAQCLAGLPACAGPAWPDRDCDGVDCRIELLRGTDDCLTDTDGDGTDDEGDPYPTDPAAAVTPIPIADVVAATHPLGVRDFEFDVSQSRLSWQAHTQNGSCGAANRTTHDVFVAPLLANGDVDVPAAVRVAARSVFGAQGGQPVPLNGVGNGPEWVAGTSAAGAVSEVLFTGWVPNAAGGCDKKISRASFNPAVGGWAVQSGMRGTLPAGTLDTGSPNPRVRYVRGSQIRVFRRNNPAAEACIGAQPQLQHRRFRADDDRFLVTTFAGNGEIYEYDLNVLPVLGVPPLNCAGNAAQWNQITNDGVPKRWAQSWRDPAAPNFVFYMAAELVGGQPMWINVYRKPPAAAGPAALHTVIYPPPGTPFVSSPESFVWNGDSYVTFQAREKPGTNVGSTIWLARIDAAGQPSGKIHPVSNNVLPHPNGGEPLNPGPEASPWGPWIYYTAHDANGLPNIRRCNMF